jgi:hypothetical protein
VSSGSERGEHEFCGTLMRAARNRRGIRNDRVERFKLGLSKFVANKAIL